MKLSKESNPEEYSKLGEEKFGELAKNLENLRSDKFSKILSIVKLLITLSIITIVMFAIYTYSELNEDSNVTLFIEQVFDKLLSYSEIIGVLLFAIIILWIIKL